MVNNEKIDIANSGKDLGHIPYQSAYRKILQCGCGITSHNLALCFHIRFSQIEHFTCDLEPSRSARFSTQVNRVIFEMQNAYDSDSSRKIIFRWKYFYLYRNFIEFISNFRGPWEYTALLGQSWGKFPGIRMYQILSNSIVDKQEGFN